MAAARSRAPAIGSAQWILDERHQSNDLITQELEDFGFTVRNELEWLNEHMAEIFAQNGQNNLDVFKTPGKLRGKTPRTARKKAAEPRQPLGDLIGANSQKRQSPAEHSLRSNLQKNTAKARFQIAEDNENVAPAPSPALAKSPVPRALFSKALGAGKENQQSSYTYTAQNASPERRPGTGHSTIPVQFSPAHSTQNTIMTYQDDDVFSPPQTQSTQPTQATQSFRRSIHTSEDERRDTGESFVSAKEAFGSKNGSKEDLRAKYDGDAMDMDDKPDVTQSDAQDTVIRHELSSVHDDTAVHHDIPDFPQPPTVDRERYSISADTQDALDTANERAHKPEPKNIVAPSSPVDPSTRTASEDAEDDTVVHHAVDDQMDIDDDVRSPSDGSSPVKPLVRKSSLTFASLPAREPLLAKKSMGNRTSHVDQNKARSSHMGRFTGGKSLGGSQLQHAESQHHDAMDLDEERPGLRREESETTKLHNKTSSQRLLERINMLKQQNEVPKRISQNILSSQSSQAQSFAASQPKESAQQLDVTQAKEQVQTSQPAYPSLPATEPERNDEDDDDDWISPIRTAAPAPDSARPPFSKSYSADIRPAPGVMLPKPISVSNPDLSTVVESTTPIGSPTGKKYMDGPLSASKAKFYSALRAAKEKIIGSSTTSAQVKLDALGESPMRPRLKAPESSEDVLSPVRNEKTGIFSHLRSPSKESGKSAKSKIAAAPGSPVKNDGRRTRSSSEREKQKEKETREKELKEKQRMDDRFKEMRDKEHSKATLHHQKSKAALAKTPVAMASQSNIRQAAATATTTATQTPGSAIQQNQSRPGTTRTNTATKTNDPDSADEMPPPPPPKSFLPTNHKMRVPKKLAKTPSNDTLPKAKPQHIRVNLMSNRYGQAPPAPSRNAPPAATTVAPPVAPKPAPAAPKPAPPVNKAVPSASTRPASALSSKGAPAPKPAPVNTKTVPRVGRPQPPKMVEKPVEKPKAPVAQPRADLAAARPVARMQTVQDVNRINVPSVNPAKPAKRPFPAENDEALYRPAKRPSQQAKMNPITPAHAQFAKGKIPFAEPAQPAQPPQPQYPNGEDIKLPDIMTDSEDEDSDNEFEQPSWVNTPNLRDLLSQQQLVDPEQIFGPIAPLNMEQVFPNKERHKRFRERTSSAYWTHDQVTEEEKRKEREARERLVRDGAWTYNPSPRPTPRPGL